MAGRYDRNPFEPEEEEVNPFSDPVVRAQATKPSYGGGGLFNDPVSNSRLSPLPHEPAFSGVDDATVDIPLGAGKDLKKKEKELKAREEELRRREQDLKRREEAAERAGIRIEKKNWPPFINILHHDIANDIPAHSRGLQRWAYASWLGILLCLFWNFICVTAAWIGGVGGVSIFLLGIVYMLSGYVLSYFLWYKPLYRAMRSDSVLRFGWFVMFYLLHIAFCVYAAVAPPFIFKGKSLAGIITAIDIFSSNIIIGIFYVVGFALFTLESLLSIWVLKGVVQYFRGEGAAAEMKRNAAASRVAI
ncbi:secretory carrier-associated membrane protein 1 [Physcomitrium patens]|uniref:Secretory carrier-associated membrane protein n=1 Tax=Physcomitrium patens TaxID=3218 RepID=A0A2K1L936_PHYPA|nr:secretory carrier-associated membrane protein 2-like [Physcomitrium patens]XP_024391404.1 secretory carrier-associated membrane protein 2-like [Physcomitrium patens]XP_024391415.1 secretory carrier-associated membrane protein 2-like [Physcomitrium patens]PNR62537.1 hypothetical protein PHYPA_000961 [Physcomitrium patens]|eukprot:XP_024391396.1 secretory carrier-associated membrane protein 2-like [Physcomitrella patens]